MSDFAVIGKGIPKVDGVDLVSGQAMFIDDVRLPNMLYGKILRAKYAHARIADIDTSRAERLPGVKAVATAEDTPKLRYGVPLIFDEIRDQPVFADDKVRYYGDPVAAVAAVDQDTAEEALELIRVEYEPLPVVSDPEEAMKPGAPVIHDHAPNNIAIHKPVYAGDVEEGFKESDVIVEGIYKAHGQEHAHMELHGAIASVDLSGNVTVWTTTQTPFTIRRDLVKMLDIPLHKINVMNHKVGGGYGGKNEVSVEPHCIVLSRKAGRPVKMTYTREEEFTASTIRHPVIVHSKIGVKKDGTIMAKQAKTIVDNGPYSNHGPAMTYYMGAVFSTLYRVKHVKYDGYLVYTNNVYGGAFRGYGNPQITFAIETEMDRVAEILNMDPVEFRLKNAPARDERSACGIRVGSCGLQECIKKAAEAVEWSKKWKGWTK